MCESGSHRVLPLCHHSRPSRIRLKHTERLSTKSIKNVRVLEKKAFSPTRPRGAQYFEDQSSADQSFERQPFDPQSFADQSFAPQPFAGQSFDDQLGYIGQHKRIEISLYPIITGLLLRKLTKLPALHPIVTSSRITEQH